MLCKPSEQCFVNIHNENASNTGKNSWRQPDRSNIIAIVLRHEKTISLRWFIVPIYKEFAKKLK